MPSCPRKYVRSSTGSWPERLKNLISGPSGPVAHAAGARPQSRMARVNRDEKHLTIDVPSRGAWRRFIPASRAEGVNASAGRYCSRQLIRRDADAGAAVGVAKISPVREILPDASAVGTQ